MLLFQILLTEYLKYCGYKICGLYHLQTLKYFPVIANQALEFHENNVRK